MRIAKPRWTAGSPRRLPIWSSSGRPSNLRGPIRSAGIEKGAVIIERPDITINLEGAGESITVSLDEDPLAPKAHLLVSGLMVLTNAALAAWAKEHGVTLLHRTQGRRHPQGVLRHLADAP